MELGRHTPTPNVGPCWYCEHYAGPCWGDRNLADCREGGGRYCKSQAEFGCASFARVPGVDDDAWAPPPKVYAAMKKPGTEAGLTPNS